MKIGQSRGQKSDGYADKALAGLISVVWLPVLGYGAWRLLSDPVDADWLLLAAVTMLVVSRLDDRLGGPRAIAVADCFFLVSLLVYGLWPAVVLAGATGAFSCVHYKDRRRLILFDAGVKGLSILAAGLVVGALFGDLTVLKAASIWDVLPAAGLAALVYCGISVGTLAAMPALAHGGAKIHKWGEHLIRSSISCLAAGVSAGILVKLISVAGFYPVILAVPVIAFTYLTYKPKSEEHESTVELPRQAGNSAESLEVLAAAIDAKEGGSPDHVRRVQIYSAGLGKYLGLSEPEMEALTRAAVLHDIGKVAVPDYILNKPGALTPAEFERMKVHVTLGADILEKAALPYPVAPVVRHHHEKWDGRGYPDGLKGDQIPITARILTLTDCFDALREEGPHGPAKTREEAVAIVKAESGKMFDPNAVRIFVEHLGEFEAEIRWQQVDLQSSLSRKSGERRAKRAPVESPRDRYERIQSAHLELTALYGLARIVSLLDFRDAFPILASRLEELVGSTTCAVYVLNPGSDDIEVAAATGRNGQQLKGKKMQPGSGVTGWVITNDQSMHNCDPALDFDALKAEIMDRYLTATVVPLMMEGEMAAALAVYSKDTPTFSADDLRLIEAVAKLASDAMSNSGRHKSSEAAGLTDGITGLPNARALKSRFEEETERARRHRDTFAVLMMDLDGFGAVNEHFGHQAGDMILRQAAQLLKSLVRSSDFISRYGSDEFIALVQASPDEITDLARRIQQVTDHHDFGPSGASLFIGVSIGGACFPDSGVTFDELLLAADRAMNADKVRRKTLLGASGGQGDPDRDRYRVM